MNYEETLQWMFRQLPMYQRQGRSAFKKDLTNIRKFCDHLGDPQQDFKSIHVGGTNGKGSTSTMIAHVLKENGYSTGLYTSPHLIDYRERVQVNFEMVSEEFVIDFIQAHRNFLEAHQLSFFEMSVGMAFAYFSAQKVDIAVVEVGLGGRLDSTNIIQPEISVITNIGYDHTDMLGDTLAQIAYEKAGIIKPGTPVIVGEKHPETHPVFVKASKKMDAPLYYTDVLSDEVSGSTQLVPRYQQKNIATAIKALSILTDTGAYRLEDPKRSIFDLIRKKGVYGKFMQLSSKPLIILDAAHNKPALEALSYEVKKLTFNRLFIVFGSVKGKDVHDLLQLLPKTAQYYFCRSSVPRAMPVGDLEEVAQSLGLSYEYFDGPAEAYHKAESELSDDDLLLVTGSTFLIADLLRIPEIKNKFD